MWIGFNYQLNPCTQQIVIIVFMDWAMLGLFRHHEECVRVSVSAAGALWFVAFLFFVFCYSFLISWCEINRLLHVHYTQTKNCRKKPTTVGRTGYKLKTACIINPNWRGIRPVVKWMAYALFIILFPMQLLCLPCEALSLIARLRRVPEQRDKWSL
jgi:hypothetical protein